MFAKPIVIVSCAAIFLAAFQSHSRAQSPQNPIAPDFPAITIAEHQPEADALRNLFWLHAHDLTPKATLWDEWLLPPTIWPSYTNQRVASHWRKTLLSRHIDSDGYVATHQHHSIAHQRGWPFPGWHQAPHSFGWHFSFHKTVGTPWRPDVIANPDDFPTTGIESAGIGETGWQFTLTQPGAALSVPAINHDSILAPFMQIRWTAEDYPSTSTPFLEWTTAENPNFTPERRMYFDPPQSGNMKYTMIPMYRHPGWRDHTITQIRLQFDNQTTDTKIVLQGIFSQFDTRHNVNNPAFVTACIDYFYWTGDLNFLRENIERMRLAMRFMETEFGTDEDGIVKMPWVGHEGTTGLIHDEQGNVTMRSGHGVGNNYWDLVPFGQKDSYATIRHFHAARKMAELEDQVTSNPQWNIPPTPLARPGDHWRRQAEMARENGNKLFWNAETGRFTLGPDLEGNQADFGFTFVNLEAIAYGFATPENARSIMQWLDGKRAVAGDDSQTTDIYHWRFAPRATTRRNIDHYGWFWNAPHHIPFGDQVQDGGAVLGFSYHDILARLQVNGPHDAGQRLLEIARWYAEVEAAGGYRAYYDGSRPGNLQGGGTPGGLGLDKEFFESVLVPHVLLDGFLGLHPTPHGFALSPQVPANWGELALSHVTVQGNVFDVRATPDKITLTPRQPLPASNGLLVQVPSEWQVTGDQENLTTHSGFQWDLKTPVTFSRN